MGIECDLNCLKSVPSRSDIRHFLSTYLRRGLILILHFYGDATLGGYLEAIPTTIGLAQPNQVLV